MQREKGILGFLENMKKKNFTGLQKNKQILFGGAKVGVKIVVKIGNANRGGG